MKLIEYINRHPENRWIILIVSCLILYSLVRVKKLIQTGKQLYSYIKKEHFIVLIDTGSIFILPMVVYCLYLAITLPLSYDESFTLKYFTNKGLWHSLTMYPAPNNHVFHTLLTIIPYKLFQFVSNAIVLRLPALLFTFLSLALVKTELGKEHGRFMIFSLLLCFSFGYIEYCFQARGYSIQIFFALWSYILYTRPDHFIERWYLLMLLTALGLYTSPAYLYFAVPIVLMFIIKSQKEIVQHFKQCSIAAIGGIGLVITLYSPIILKSGYGVITDNQTVSPLDHITVADIFNHSVTIFKWFVFADWGVLIPILFIFLSVVTKKPQLLLLLFCTTIMMFALKQLPFPRIFTPLYVVCILSIIQNVPETVFKTLIPKGVQSFIPARLNLPLSTLILALACFISLTKYSESKNKGDIHTAFEMQRLTQECEMTHLYVDTNVSWYFKTTYEAYCILNKFEPKYVNDETYPKQIQPEPYFITSKQPSIPLDSFSFIVPHYLFKQ